MLTFITDVRENEPDILTPIKHLNLQITDGTGEVLATVAAPCDGWTHNKLEQAFDQLIISEDYSVLDAYLGDIWVGSTEV